MKTVEIHTSPFCGYCHAAERLLAGKGVPFAEIDVIGDPEAREEMMGDYIRDSNDVAFYAVQAGRAGLPPIFAMATTRGVRDWRICTVRGVGAGQPEDP